MVPEPLPVQKEETKEAIRKEKEKTGHLDKMALDTMYVCRENVFLVSILISDYKEIFIHI